jgi:hypothetical protein
VYIELAVLADYAAVMADGKLMVAGVFDTLTVSELPVAPPIIYLALRVAGDAAEFGPHDLELRVIDPDGTPVIPSVGGRFSLTPHEDAATIARTQFVMQMVGMAFKKEGPHALDVLLDGRYEQSIPLDVKHSVRAPG